MVAEAILLDTRLEQDMWESVTDYVWKVHNLYPLSRNATRNGRGPRPLTQMSKNHVDEDECDRRIEYSIPPGALAFVHQPGKHGGAQDISNGRWSRCVGIDKDTPIFEQVPKPPLGKTYRSKNFKVYDLKPGLSAYESKEGRVGQGDVGKVEVVAVCQAS